mgnify:CR=1 FL=1
MSPAELRTLGYSFIKQLSHPRIKAKLYRNQDGIYVMVGSGFGFIAESEDDINVMLGRL